MRFVIGLFIGTFSSIVSADQFLIPNLREAETLFWSKLYSNTHYTLYCGERFTGRNEDLEMEAIYPIEWVVNHLKCNGVSQCREESGRFNRIEADLHNYYPALKNIVRARSNFKYGSVSGEFREFFECDFEQDVRNEVVEPRPLARGNIARAMFYMHWEYGLPIEAELFRLIKEWNIDDPVSKDEKRRNDTIEKLQGTRNPFVDDINKAKEIGR